MAGLFKAGTHLSEQSPELLNLRAHLLKVLPVCWKHLGVEHFQDVYSCLQKSLKLGVEEARHGGGVKLWLETGGCFCSEAVLGGIWEVSYWG